MAENLLGADPGEFGVYDARLAALALLRGVPLRRADTLPDGRLVFVFEAAAVRPVLLEWRTQSANVPLGEYLNELRRCSALIQRARIDRRTVG